MLYSGQIRICYCQVVNRISIPSSFIYFKYIDFLCTVDNIVCYLPKMSKLFQGPYIYSTAFIKHLGKYQAIKLNIK